MTNPLVVGIDVHRKNNTIALMDATGRMVSPSFSVENNRPGTTTLASRLQDTAQSNGYDAIHVAAEATGWYWWHLFRALATEPESDETPTELYAFNPRVTATFRKTYSRRDKTDRIDAVIIADRLRFGRDLPHPYRYDEPYESLRLLTRHRYRLVHQITREKAYCLAHLYLKASEYTRIMPFSDPFGATSRAMLRDYSSIEEIAAMPFDDLVESIDQCGHRRFPDPQQNAEKLLAVVQDSYPLPQALQPAVNQILRDGFSHIAALQSSLRRIESAIAETMESFPNTLESIPGMGPVYAAGIISELGHLARFDYDHAKIASYAGLTWPRKESADYHAEETPLNRSGNRFLRYYLCEAANSVQMCDPVYRAYYVRKLHEVPKHQHKRAIVLTARKLIRLVTRLLTTNQPYQPRRT